MLNYEIIYKSCRLKGIYFIKHDEQLYCIIGNNSKECIDIIRELLNEKSTIELLIEKRQNNFFKLGRRCH